MGQVVADEDGHHNHGDQRSHQRGRGCGESLQPVDAERGGHGGRGHHERDEHEHATGDSKHSKPGHEEDLDGDQCQSEQEQCEFEPAGRTAPACPEEQGEAECRSDAAQAGGGVQFEIDEDRSEEEQQEGGSAAAEHKCEVVDPGPLDLFQLGCRRNPQSLFEFFTTGHRWFGEFQFMSPSSVDRQQVVFT